MDTVQLYGDDTVVARIRDLGLGKNNARSVALLAKTQVPGGSTANPDYSSLMDLRGFGELRAGLERRLLPSALDRAWKLPFNASNSLTTSVSTGYWIEPGRGKPVSGFVTAPVRLEPHIVAALSVLTRELLEATGAAADAAIIRISINALAARVNATFLSADAAADGAPAGIGAGATTMASTGTTAAALQDDLQALVEMADGAGVNLQEASWIMSPARASAIALALHVQTLGLRGGTLLGAPAHTDPAAAGNVYLIDASRLAVAVGMPDVDFAESATIEMVDDPTNASSPAVATSLVSMFQTDSIAVRSTLAIDWQAAANSVFLLAGAAS